MTNIIILTLATLGILAMFGALAFVWLCATVTGRTVAWLVRTEEGAPAETAHDLLSPAHIAEIDALVENSQRMARQSQQRAALSRT